jgi:hypothetical protein
LVTVESGGIVTGLNMAAQAVVNGRETTLDVAAIQAAFGPVATALQNATGANFTDGVDSEEEEALQEAIEELLELLDDENPAQDDATPD